MRADNAERINTFIALQFLFDHFWKQLKVGVRLAGHGLQAAGVQDTGSACAMQGHPA